MRFSGESPRRSGSPLRPFLRSKSEAYGMCSRFFSGSKMPADYFLKTMAL